jgi:hypothetical protein
VIKEFGSDANRLRIIVDKKKKEKKETSLSRWHGSSSNVAAISFDTLIVNYKIILRVHVLFDDIISFLTTEASFSSHKVHFSKLERKSRAQGRKAEGLSGILGNRREDVVSLEIFEN